MWVAIAVVLFLGAAGVSLYAMSLRRKTELLRLSRPSQLADSYAARRLTRRLVAIVLALLVASIAACLLPLILQ